MPLAACMILRQCRFQLVKLSRPFGLSLLRLFESFNIIVYVSISSFSSLSFIDMSACSVFIVVCLFRILYFICILLSYFWLLGILNLMMINQSIKLYIYTAPVKVRVLSQAPPTSMRAQTRQFLTIAWTVPVRCPRSSDCQADCSTLCGRKHGSFWVQNGQMMIIHCKQ